MRFEHPQILNLLFALPLLGLFFWWSFRRKRRLLERFAHVKVIGRLIASTSRRKQIAKAAGLAAAQAFIVVALARPQWGAVTRPIERKGIDLLVAIDTSRSMLARDVPPDRLTRAKRELQGIIRRVRGDRVGIVPFAGTAYVACPLTLDYGLAMAILDTVDIHSVPIQGTAIGTAIKTASETFQRTARGQRVLVLLTDGEDQGTDPIGEAEKAAKEGVIVYAIGIGSREGNPIPVDGALKKDAEGNPVNSRLDAETLQKIALKTGGKYIEGKPSGELELDEIYASIDQFQKTLQESKTYTIYEERFAWFLLPAILILAWELFQNDRRKAAGAWQGRFK